MTRPIELVEMEALDAAHELAECIRAQAESMLKRADGLESASKLLISPADISRTDTMRIANDAVALHDRYTLLHMQEQELTLKYQRLALEWSGMKAKEQR